MIYPLVKWTLNDEPQDILLTCQHWDRYDFESYRKRLRKKLKRELLINFDSDASHVRETIRLEHANQRSILATGDLEAAFRETLKFGSDLRKKLYYLDDYLSLIHI